TIASFAGTWWMFVGVLAPHTSEAALLCLYYASSPLGPWMPHEHNPVRLDVRSTRPGGPLFKHEGRWYRPVQLGVPSYGSAITVSEVAELDTSKFVERPMHRIFANWRNGLTGLHSFAEC